MLNGIGKVDYISSTGMKCLPAAKVAKVAGLVLHDWHAETVSIRAFNHFLLQECLRLVEQPDAFSPIIRRRDATELSEISGLQPFTVREEIEIFLYSSEAPCGDASMELVMEAQEDRAPWLIVPTHISEPPSHSLPGRAFFSELGRVRRKPCMDSTEE